MATAQIPQPNVNEGTQAYIRRLAGMGFETSNFEGQIPDIGRTPLATGQTLNIQGALQPGITPQQLASIPGVTGNLKGEPVPTYAQLSAQVPQTISSSNLANTQGGNFGTYSPNSNPPTPASSVKLEGAEQSGQNVSNRLLEIQNQLKGKAAFETSQESQFGIPDLKSKEIDLSAQLEAINQDIKNIPLTSAQPNQTGAMLGAQQREQLMQASIKSNFVAGSLASIQNKLGLAEYYIKKAVDAKFGPIIEEKTLLLESLGIIKESPAYDAETKKRAADLANQTNDTKADASAIWKVATDAASKSSSFTATSQYPTLESAFTAINNAKTPAEALNIAASTGLTGKPDTTVASLMKTYPDAGILSSDTPEIASTKASTSFSFSAKNNLIRAITDPITGEITYYYSKGGPGGAVSTPGASVPGTTPTKSTGFSSIPNGDLVKPAVESIFGQSYIDLSKLDPNAISLASKVANEKGLPLLSGADSNKVQEANRSYLSASSLINQIRNLTKDVITAGNNPVSMSSQAAKLYLIEKAPTLSTNEKAKEFISAKNSLLSLITRASGENGVLTNTDVNRIANALPSYGDSKELAQKKATNLDNVIKSVVQGAVQAYVGNSTQGQQSVVTQKDGSEWKQNPDGSYTRVK